MPQTLTQRQQWPASLPCWEAGEATCPSQQKWPVWLASILMWVLLRQRFIKCRWWWWWWWWWWLVFVQFQDNYGLSFYGKSQNLMKLAREEYNKVFADYDVLIMPTTKSKAPKLPTGDVPIGGKIDVVQCENILAVAGYLWLVSVAYVVSSCHLTEVSFVFWSFLSVW